MHYLPTYHPPPALLTAALIASAILQIAHIAIETGLLGRPRESYVWSTTSLITGFGGWLVVTLCLQAHGHETLAYLFLACAFVCNLPDAVRCHRLLDQRHQPAHAPHQE